MDSTEIAANLRTLQGLVEGSGFKKEAFDLWDEVKSDLPAKHRFRLIVAWSKSVDADSGDRFSQVCEMVIQDIQEGAT